MTDGDTVAQLAVVVLLLGLSAPTLGTAHTYAGTPLNYTETATIDFSSDYSVSEATTVENYTDRITIDTNGDTLTKGTDYRWDADAGNVEWTDTSDTEAGNTATIEYQAHQRTAETAAAWTIIAPLVGLFGLFALISAVRVLWQYSAEVFE